MKDCFDPRNYLIPRQAIFLNIAKGMALVVQSEGRAVSMVSRLDIDM